jgi:hypothetical protein
MKKEGSDLNGNKMPSQDYQREDHNTHDGVWPLRVVWKHYLGRWDRASVSLKVLSYLEALPRWVIFSVSECLLQHLEVTYQIFVPQKCQVDSFGSSGILTWKTKCPEECPWCSLLGSTAPVKNHSSLTLTPHFCPLDWAHLDSAFTRSCFTPSMELISDPFRSPT